MRNQIRYEWYRISKDKKNMIIPVLLFLFFMVIFSQLRPKEMKSDLMESYAYTLYQLEEGLPLLMEESQKFTSAKIALADTEEEIDMVKKIIKYNQEGNNEKEIKYQILYETKILSNIKSGKMNGISILEQEKKLETFFYLQKKSISYVDSNSQAIKGSNFILALYQFYVPVMLILVFPLLILSSLFSKEKDEGENNFLNSIPLSFRTMVSAKLFASGSYIMGALLIVSLSAGVVVSGLNGVGNFNYPVAIVSGLGNNVEILSISHYLFIYTCFFIFILLFLACFALLCSRFVKGFFNLFFILASGILIIQYSPITNSMGYQQIAHFIPFSYFNIPVIIEGGNEIYPLLNQHLTIQNGIICLVSYSLLFIVVSSVIIAKQKKI
ncbi:membrane hypothetical protein [Carnobacterium maltaromaticum]|uniref:hypothetical protein n=1 Tax=Carnobacterium maltaromaticum TaxID=2751 RepID=UPI00191BAD19|nr:hypothetical protein [Carnobacterium maltaromaticum]CAD5900330.1 membrane hypothetical protein [Carnobacterium maltaromaticum]